MNSPGWLNRALQDVSVTDIVLNGPERAFIDRGSGLEPLNVHEAAWSADEMRAWVVEQITAVGKAWDARHPFIDAAIQSGHRVHVAFPPLARQGLLISLRRLPTVNTSSDGLARWSVTPRSAQNYELLRRAARDGESILLSGATGSGKTTLATDLIAQTPANERIIALEDTPELAPAHPHFLSLISRPPNADGCGEITLRVLLRQALRMRPDRIVLGECRGPEVLDLLQAMNTGHRGLLATLHANSPRDALRRVELLCLLAGGTTLPLLAIRELLAVGVQWIAQVQRGKTAREITEVCRIEGREGETLLLRPFSTAC